MAKYRKVDPRVWNDAKFRALNDDGKLVVFFLLTHPHMTAVGAMRATPEGLAAELGWTAKGFREAFQEVCAKGIARHDERGSMVWLPKFLRYNPPESPNVVKAWAGALEYLPECDLLSEVVQSVNSFLDGMSEAYRKALPEAFAKAMANPEPEPEPEPEKHSSASAPVALRSRGDARFAEFWSVYPRREDKKKARDKWRAKGLDALADRIVADVQERRARHRGWREGFVPLPTTYLNGERWEDAIDDTPPKGGEQRRGGFADVNYDDKARAAGFGEVL